MLGTEHLIGIKCIDIWIWFQSSNQHRKSLFVVRQKRSWLYRKTKDDSKYTQWCVPTNLCPANRATVLKPDYSAYIRPSHSSVPCSSCQIQWVPRCLLLFIELKWLWTDNNVKPTAILRVHVWKEIQASCQTSNNDGAHANHVTNRFVVIVNIVLWFLDNWPYNKQTSLLILPMWCS